LIEFSDEWEVSFMFDDGYSDGWGDFNPAAERRYRLSLAAFPDCRDPDHPGCEYCEEGEDDE
jgi:hypothetical protein